MVKAADEVYAFVAREDLDRGEMTGTLHIAEKALDKRKPVKLYTEVNGNLIWAGENE
jgi:hypothetical protein